MAIFPPPAGSLEFGIDGEYADHDADIFNPNNPMFFVVNLNDARRRVLGAFAEVESALVAHDAVAEAAERARAGDGPTLIEARFYRYVGHFVADDEATEELARIFRVPRTDDGYFLEDHVKLRPVDLPTPGLYVAGTATAGTQQAYTVFIETCHIHAQRISAALQGLPPPPDPPPPPVPSAGGHDRPSAFSMPSSVIRSPASIRMRPPP